VLDCHPEDAGYIRCGEDTFGFEKFGVAGWAGKVGDDTGGAGVLLQLDHGEHLAADGLVADPEDETSELLGFADVREGEEIGADAFGVHAGKYRASSGGFATRIGLALLFEFARCCCFLVGSFDGRRFLRGPGFTASLFAWGFSGDGFEAGPTAGALVCGCHAVLEADCIVRFVDTDGFFEEISSGEIFGMFLIL
jgi:hypothetical protein